MFNTEQSFRPTLAETKRARSINYMGTHLTFHADGSDTGGKFAVIESHATRGSEPPLHIHEYEDEFFYVMEGQIEVVCGGETQTLLPGQSALLPRGIPHTFRVIPESARFLVHITPAGFEDYFRTLGRLTGPSHQPVPPPPDRERLLRVAQDFGLTFVAAS
jgi:quercetin dioxygenase-like cupin family protein